MDSATDFLFGESVESLDVFLRRGLCHVSRGLATRMRLGPLMIFHHDRTSTKAARDARAYVGRFVRQEIAYRAANDKGDGANKLNQRYVFLYEPSKTTLDAGMLTDQLLNIMLAGRDTTAGLLSITFFITLSVVHRSRQQKTT
jgi:cytochrome P450